MEEREGFRYKEERIIGLYIFAYSQLIHKKVNTVHYNLKGIGFHEC
jgi:hypothetical protein